MAESGTTTKTLGKRLRDVLEAGPRTAGIEAQVETEPVPITRLHRAIAVSRQFRYMGQLERQEVVWRIVGHALTPEEQQRVSTILTVTPKELGW